MIALFGVESKTLFGLGQTYADALMDANVNTFHALHSVTLGHENLEYAKVINSEVVEAVEKGEVECFSFRVADGGIILEVE